MTEFSEGDLVEARKGERRVIDRVETFRTFDGDTYLFINGVGRLSETDYTVTLVERAELPTEPGWYLDYEQRAWELDEAGDWYTHFTPNAKTTKYAAAHAPFTRLEPVPVTAMKVLGTVRVTYYSDDPKYWAMLDRVAADFGVESDPTPPAAIV